MTDPSEKHVTTFKWRGYTYRLIVDPHQEDRPTLEQFAGVDGLGRERWIDADVDELHREIGTDRLVREVVEVVANAARKATKPAPLSVDARTLLARALDEWQNGAGLRGVIQANPFEVFELLGLTRAEDIERMIGDREELRP